MKEQKPVLERSGYHEMQSESKGSKRIEENA